MAFTILKKDTLIDEIEINNNFYHIRQGDFLPRAGESLTAIDNSLNMGETANRYNDLHCNNLEVETNITNVWYLVAATTLDATASSIEFTGLNSDNDQMYNIALKAVSGTTATFVINIYFNGDSTAANYGFQKTVAQSTAVTGTRNTSAAIEVGSFLGTSVSQSDILIYSKTGNERLLIAEYLGGGSGTTVYTSNINSGIWNSSATISSLKIEAASNSFVTNTNIQVWAKR